MELDLKVGEIKQIDGEWYQCLEGDGYRCNYCDYDGLGNCDEVACSSDERSDNKDVYLRRLEKIGEPFELLIDTNKTVLMQEYKIYGDMYIWENKGVLHTDCFNGIRIEIKQNKKEDMGGNKTPLPKEDNSLTRIVYAYVNGKISDNELIKSIKEMSDEYPFEKNNLKPFSLEEAKQGKPVCTRDGRKVRIISFDREFLYDGQNYCIVALINDGPHNEIVYSYTKDGLYNPGKIHERDLMMLPEKKSGWMNVYEERIYDTKQGAIKAKYDGANYIDTIKISWEE